MKKFITLIIYASIASLLELYLINKNSPLFFMITTISSIVLLIFIFLIMGWLKLDDDNLLKQPLFIASIIVPLHTFIMYGLWAWKDNSISLSSTGFKNFIEISKLPLLILASSVPLAAIVNNIHRTIQTRKQIKIAETNNLGNAFYTQQKYITDIFNNFPEYTIGYENNKDYEDYDFTKKLKIKYPHRIYKKIYPKSNAIEGPSYEIGPELKLLIKFFWSEIDAIINEAINNDDEHRDIYYIHHIENLIFSFMKELGISFIEQKYSNTQQSRKFIITTNFFSADEIGEVLKSLHSVCDEIYAVIGLSSNFLKKHSETDDFLNRSVHLFSNFGRNFLPTPIRKPDLIRLMDLAPSPWDEE